VLVSRLRLTGIDNPKSRSSAPGVIAWFLYAFQIGTQFMAKEIETPNLFNPMMLWTDLGMRAMEMTLSSSQKMADGIDRVSRANASPQASETARARIETIRQEPAPALPAFPDPDLFWQMQRFTTEWMIQGWQQWMNAFGSLASLGGRR
jgi:hypothetical protein